MVATAALSVDGRPGYGPGVVVVSALGGVTRALVEIANAPSASVDRVNELEERHQSFRRLCGLTDGESDAVGRHLSSIFDELRTLLRSPSHGQADVSHAAFQDSVLAAGELAASRLFCAILQSLGVDGSWMDAREFMVTDDRFRSAQPQLEHTRELVDRALRPRLDGPRTIVVPGFIARTEDGRTTTMGFEASDLTATVLGAALGAREVQIWTDVSGVLTADPRVVSDARPLPHLHYDSARELAVLGARVLHPNTMRPARDSGIQVRVANSLRPGDGGTKIDATEPAPGLGAVVAARRNQTVVSVCTTQGLGEAVLAFVVELARRTGPSDALFALEHGAEIDCVHVVSGNPRPLASLAEQAQPLGSVSTDEGLAVVSLINTSGGRPDWPDADASVLRWHGLHRSVGRLVDDASAVECVRAVHAAVNGAAAETRSGEG